MVYEDPPLTPEPNIFQKLWSSFRALDTTLKFASIFLFLFVLAVPVIIAQKTEFFSHAGTSLFNNCTPIPTGMTQEQIKQLSQSGQVNWCTQTATQNPIQKENAKQGTSDWTLSKPSTAQNHEIEGYASSTSVSQGQSIGFSVRTTAPTFSATIYRLGWYAGLGARLVDTVSNLPGNAYPIPTMDANSFVSANWPTAFSVTPTSDWTSGLYIVKLTDANGYQSYIPFVVKAPDLSDALVFVHAVNTDEAYNYYGGASLYPYIRPGPIGAVVNDVQATHVSFDRPFIQNFGAGQVFRYEYPFVRWAEQQGYDLSYMSDVDIHENPQALLNRKGVLVVGHDEYWSKSMRDAYENAVAGGVNIANFAANSSYWQIRYGANTSGATDRVIIAYKGLATDNPPYKGDPDYGVDNSNVTTQFGDPLLNRSEQKLLGMRWQASFEPLFAGPWKVKIPAAGVYQSPQQDYSWLYAGTNLKDGDIIPNLVGYEFDTVDWGIKAPQNVEVVANNTFVDSWKNTDTVFSTLYTAPSGARIFNAGTIDWAWGLDPYAPQAPDPYANRPQVPSTGIQQVQQITANILNNFLGLAVTTPTPTPTQQSPYVVGSKLFGPVDSNTASVTAGDSTWKNYRVTFAFTPNWSTNSNQHAGVQVHVNNGNYIWVFARPSGIRWAQTNSTGTFGEKALSSTAITSGQKYTMQVDIYNSTINVSLNGQNVGSIDLSTLPTSYASGGIKVYSYNTTNTLFNGITVNGLVPNYTTGNILFGPVDSLTTAVSAGSTSWQDYRVAFSFTPNWSTNSNQHTGVQVRINGNTYIWIFARPSGIRWAQTNSTGTFGEKVLSATTITSGQKYTMQVDIYGTMVYVSLNGQQVGTIDLRSLTTSYASGGIKVYSYNTTSVGFNGITVWAITPIVTTTTTTSSAVQSTQMIQINTTSAQKDD